MAHRVCPWWLGYFLVTPLRRLWQDPRAILEPYVREGMSALEAGPGMGFFTLELARRVGPAGRRPRFGEATLRCWSGDRSTLAPRTSIMTITSSTR